MGLLAKITTGAAFLAVVALPMSAFAQQEKVTLKMHSAYGSSLPVLGSMPTRLIETVSKASNGTLDLQFFEPNALVPAYGYTDALSQGAIPVAFGASGFHAAKDPAMSFFNVVPFGPKLSEYMAWMRYGGGQELADKAYAKLNMKAVICGVIPPEAAGWFREEITSLDQLQGLKMRFFGLGGKVIAKFGASPLAMAGGEIYQALELGVIDATEYSMPAIDASAGFEQIAKHYYFPGWHQQASLQMLEFNKDVWDGLSDWHKSVIEIACAANVVEAEAEGDAIQNDALAKFKAAGVEIHTFSDEMLAQIEAAWNEVAEETVAGNPDAEEVWNSLKKFREESAEWQSRAYMQ